MTFLRKIQITVFTVVMALSMVACDDPNGGKVENTVNDAVGAMVEAEVNNPTSATNLLKGTIEGLGDAADQIDECGVGMDNVWNGCN